MAFNKSLDITDICPAHWVPVVQTPPRRSSQRTHGQATSHAQPRLFGPAGERVEALPSRRGQRGIDFYAMHDTLGIYPQYQPGAIVSVSA